MSTTPRRQPALSSLRGLLAACVVALTATLLAPVPPVAAFQVEEFSRSASLPITEGASPTSGPNAPSTGPTTGPTTVSPTSSSTVPTTGSTLGSTADTAGRTTSRARHPRPRPPRAWITVLPAIHQPGAAAANLGQAKMVAAVTLATKRMVRPVRLQRRLGDKWRTMAVTTLRRGSATFAVRLYEDAVYRAVLPRKGGWRRIQTRPVTNTWGRADWADEFNGDALGPAWEHRIQFYNPWGGRACSKGDPSAVAVNGGRLFLSSMPDPNAAEPCPVKDKAGNVVGYYPYRLNGHVSTQSTADFQYGVAAARMRFPRQLGQHASFWLQPRGLLTTGTTPWGAEIDVVEWYGANKDKRRMAMAVHAPQPDGSKRQIGGTIRDPDRYLATRTDSWWSRFHVFSVEWTPREYLFRIDNHLVWRTREGISHVPQFLILSMLSSDYELPDVGDDPTPRTAEVDWVAFWRADRA